MAIGSVPAYTFDAHRAQCRARAVKHNNEQKVQLFSYGTLQRGEVQLATFGRALEGHPDALEHYQIRMVRIFDQAFIKLSGAEYHRTLEFTDNATDQVEGTVLTLTKTELQQADDYEPAGYERRLVTLRSGQSAWIYAADARLLSRQQ